MTDKNIKKLLIGLGVPIDKQAAIIEKSNKDDEDWDVNDVLEAAKKWAEPLLKPTIEKDARKAGASGAISKVLEAVYNSIKDDKTGTLEEWKKTVESKDYADLVRETIATSKLAGISQEDAVKELNTKLTAALKVNEETPAIIDKINKDWEAKLSERDLIDAKKEAYHTFAKKPIKPATYKYFETDLADKEIEMRMYEGKLTPFKKSETTPMQNEKKTAHVKFDDLFSEWANENPGLFVQSGGNGGGNDEENKDKQKNVKIDEQRGVKTVGTNRPVPID